MKEAFVATLLVIVAHRAAVYDSGDDDLDRFILWREIQKQVKILRDEM